MRPENYKLLFYFIVFCIAYAEANFTTSEEHLNLNNISTVATEHQTSTLDAETSTGNDFTTVLPGEESTTVLDEVSNFTVDSNGTTPSGAEEEYDFGEYADDYLVYLSIKDVHFYWGMFFISCLGFLSNVILIATMLKSRRLRSNSAGILMITLAFFDAILMITEVIRHVEIYHVRIFKPYCLIHTFVMNVMRSASHLITLLISVNRYALVCHPFKHTKVTSRSSTIRQLVAVFIFCVLGSIFTLFVWDPIGPRCILVRTYQKGMMIYYVGVISMVMVLSGIVPILVTFFLSVKVIYTMKMYKEELGDAVSTKGAMSRKAGERQVTWALISVNLAFVILNFPYMVGYCVYFVGGLGVKYNLGTTINNHIARMLLKMCDTLNYVLNFYLYTYFSQTFRQAFVNLICCRKDVKSSGSKYSATSQSKTAKSCDDDVTETEIDKN